MLLRVTGVHCGPYSLNTRGHAPYSALIVGRPVAPVTTFDLLPLSQDINYLFVIAPPDIYRFTGLARFLQALI